jgi:hypothetical protein
MSDIIFTPPASSGGTTINPTNNFIPKRSNATTFVDSVLENGSNYLYSNYGGFTGLGLDFLNFVSYLGDWNNLINGTTLVVNDATSNIFTKYNGFVQGINLNFTNNDYLFGNISNGFFYVNANNQYAEINVGGVQYLSLDKINASATFFDYANGNGLEFIAPNKTFFLKVGSSNVISANYGTSGNLDIGTNQAKIICETANSFVRIGDVDAIGNGTIFSVDDSNKQIVTFTGGTDNGISIDFASSRYYFGDFNGLNNSTHLFIGDSGQTIYFYTENLHFNGALLQSNSSSGNSGEHLVITLNGNQYKIKLENP